MIWHIIKRELFDHINSLRFVLTFLILVQAEDQFDASKDAALRQIDTDFDDRMEAIKEKSTPNMPNMSELEKLFETSPEEAMAAARKMQEAWDTEGDEEMAC